MLDDSVRGTAHKVVAARCSSSSSDGLKLMPVFTPLNFS